MMLFILSMTLIVTGVGANDVRVIMLGSGIALFYVIKKGRYV